MIILLIIAVLTLLFGWKWTVFKWTFGIICLISITAYIWVYTESHRGQFIQSSYPTPPVENTQITETKPEPVVIKPVAKPKKIKSVPKKPVSNTVKYEPYTGDCITTWNDMCRWNHPKVIKPPVL